MLNIQEIIEHLSQQKLDPVPNFIFVKEIQKLKPSSPDYINSYNAVKQTKWYRDLSDDQWEDGSWGMFHGGDVQAQKRQKFPCTEAALRRAREMSLTKDDPIIAKCIKIMESQIRGETEWPDRIETHKDKGKGNLIWRTAGTAANLNVIDSDNPLITPFRDNVIEILKESFASGNYNEEVFDRAIQDYRVCVIFKPGNAFSLMLLSNSNCMDDSLQRQYLDYVWNKKSGVMYLTNYPITAARNKDDDCRQVEEYKANIEDSNFCTWLSLLELFSGFALFPELMRENVLTHLLNEATRLIYCNVSLPNPPGGHVNACNHTVNGRYAESWRNKSKKKTDMVLRIARLLVKC